MKRVFTVILLAGLLFSFANPCQAFSSEYQYLIFCDEGDIYVHYDKLSLWTDLQKGPILESLVIIDLNQQGITVYKNLTKPPITGLKYISFNITYILNAKTYITSKMVLFDTNGNELFTTPGYPSTQPIITESFEHKLGKALFEKALVKYNIQKPQ